MKKVLNKLILVLLLAFSQPILSQIDTVFWFAAPWVTVGHANNVPVVLRLSSFNNATTVRVRQPASTFDTTFIIPANSLITESLSHLINLIENVPANTVLNRGIKITSNFPITAIYEVVTSGNNPETYSLKGQNGMGLEFVCPFQTNGLNWAFTPTAKSQIDIVASQNATTIWITPKCNIVGHTAGITYSISLNAGQSYNIENITNISNVAGQNLSGTIIIATKPISVSVTDDSVRGVTGCMDLMGDQIVPVEVVGTEYIINKGGLDIVGGNFEGGYIVATDNFTQISINDGAITNIILNKGDTYYYKTAQVLTYFSGDKPFYLIHASGFGCELGEAIIPPLNCAGSDQVSFTRTNTQTFILNILCKTIAKGNFLLNGSATLVPAASFSIVPGTGGVWSGAQITFSTSQIPVGITNLLKNTNVTDNLFSMGVINGGASTGCLYHYMSSFLRKVYTNAGVDKNLCTQTKTITLTGTVTGGSTTGIWTTPNGTGTFGNTTNLNTTYTLSTNDLNQSQIKFILSSTGNCKPVIDTMLLNIFPSPIVDAGNGKTLCKNNISLIPLSGSLQLAAGANWTSSGNGSFGNAGSINTTYLPSPTDLLGDSLTLKLTSTGSLNGCPNRYDSLKIYFTKSPVVLVGPDASICANNATVVINGSVSIGSTTGIWSGGSGIFLSSNTALTATYTPTPTEITTGFVKLILTSTNNGNCKQVKDSLLINFTSSPNVTAGSDISSCKNNINTNLTGIISGPTTTGIWSGGLGVFTPSNTVLNSLYTPTPAEITAGFVNLILTSSNNGNCKSSKDTVKIVFTNAPVTFAGVNLISCKNKAVTALSGLVSGITTTGVWSGGGGSYTANNTVLTASYTPSAAEIAAGFVNLILTSTNNGNCIPVKDTVLITFSGSPLVAVGPDKSLCANNASVTINGSVTIGATTGIWSGGSGVFNPSNTVLTATYVPSIADINAGFVNLTLSSTNNGNCNPEMDDIFISFTSPPSTDAGVPIIACKNNPTAILSGNVSGPTTTGIWTGGLGTYNPNNTDLNSLYTPTAAEVTAGYVKLFLTSSNNGNCIQTKDSVLINFSPAPIVNAGLNLIACKNNAAIALSGIVSGPTNTGIWSGGGGSYTSNSTVLSATYTPSSAEIAAGFVNLILSSTNNGNCLAEKDTVLITFSGSPLVVVGPDAAVCANNATVIINGSVTIGATTGIWSGGSGVFVPSNTVLTATYVPSIADVNAGFVNLTLSSTNNGICNAEMDDVFISFTSPPSTDAGAPIIACENNPTAVLSGNITGPTSTGIWTGGLGTYNPNNNALSSLYTPTAAEISAGFVKLILTSLNNAGCNASTDSVLISFSNAPIVNAGLNLVACKNNAATVLSGIVTGPTITGNWSGGGGIYIANSAALNATYTPSAAEIVAGYVNLTLTSTNNGNCNQVTDTVKIVFTNSPVVSIGPDISLCANNPTVAINGSVTIGATTGVWSGTGTGLFSPTTTSLNTTYQLSSSDVAAGSFIIKLTSTNNGICKSESDSLIVNITPKPDVDAGINDTICSNNVFYPINGIVTGGASAGIWSTLGNGSFGNINNLNTIYTLGQADTLAGQVKLVLTSTGGNCLPEQDTVLVIIAKSPLVNSGLDNTICDNLLIPLNGTVVGLTTSGVWSTLGTGTFTPDDSLLTTFYQPSVLDISNGSVKIVLSSTYNKGCIAVKDTVNITFKTSPNSDFTTNNECAHKLATFTDASTIATGSISAWSWNFGDTNTSAIKSPTHVYTNPGTYTVTHVVYGVNGCNDTVKKPIEIYFLPQAQFYYNNSCVGNSTQFFDSTKTVSGIITNWSWNFGDSQSSIIQNPQHAYSSATSYSVTLIATTSFGCKDTIQKIVSVIAGPNADFSVNPNPVEALDAAAFTDLSTGPSAIINWYWAFGDGTASNTQNTSHVFNNQGDYNVFLIVKDLNGCIDTAKQEVSVILLPDVPTAFTPNGDGQNDVFLVRGGPFKSLNVRIYNNWGQLIFETNDQLSGWKGTFNDVEQPIGVYVWVVEVEMLNSKKIKKTGDVTLLR